MATHSKRSSKPKRISYAGIPAKRRRAVRALIHLHAGADGVTYSPRQAWAHLRAGWKEVEEKKQADEQKLVDERKSNIRESALAALEPALGKLVDVLDLATAIEDGDTATGHFDSGSLGMFARLAIHEAGSELEQALCDLGLIDEDSCSKFVGNLRRRGSVTEEPA